MKAFVVLRLLAVGGAAAFLQGCPPSGTTEFINSTGQPITIHYADNTVFIPAGSSYSIKGFTWPEKFEIDTPRHTWRYTNVYVGHDFLSPTFALGLRIQRDGRIYAFQNAAAAKKFSGQPPGYPLRPTV